jgi:hypothetical protein
MREGIGGFAAVMVAIVIIAIAAIVFVRPFEAAAASGLVYKQDRRCHDDEAAAEGQGSSDVGVYTNATTDTIDVTGDLIVAKNTCTVRVVYGPGPGEFYEITPDRRNDSQDSRTVKVPGDFQMKVHCRVTDRRNKCEWKFQRTTP